MKELAIIILSDAAFPVAQRLKSHFSNSKIYGFEKRVTLCDECYLSFSELTQQLYKQNIALIACCASGIIIRALAPLLQDKYSEPPVICLSEDGELVVPLLGAANGANRLARDISALTDGFCAITSNGERRFGINLLDPPKDLELVNPQHAKSFISRLINGESVKVKGQHAWLDEATLPQSEHSTLAIQVIAQDEPVIIDANSLSYRKVANCAKGKLSIVGLGPGDKSYLTPSAKKALDEADDILGYDFYIKLAAPFHKHQTIHESDNRQELERASHAIDLAGKGKKVALVSSGDPGIFAMAAAIFEVIDDRQENMPNIEINIEPGITSAIAAAAKMGAPLGHDFAMISLSDNLKPFNIIAERLQYCCKADMALALYNPVSKARPEKIIEAINIIKTIRSGDTPVGLGHDITRPTQKLKITTLRSLKIEDITSRTVIIIGSSKSKIVTINDQQWFYTPRTYQKD